jgi:4-hydroxy-3-methylbut-2-enyl diphosphate reductase
MGTIGQVDRQNITVVETVEEAAQVRLDKRVSYAYVTQTTLSVDDTAEIVAILRRRVPGLHGPAQDDICYATTNRQHAVKVLARRCDVVVVLGGTNSSNSHRLMETAREAGCRKSYLIEFPRDLDPLWLHGCRTLGITSGASTPEIVVEELISLLRQDYRIETEFIAVADERVRFRGLSVEALA